MIRRCLFALLLFGSGIGVAIGMDENDFWTLMEVNSSSGRDSDELARALLPLSSAELHDFQMHVEAASNRMTSRSVALACALLNNGYFTDDGYAACRAWIISRGRKACEHALAAPDKLLQFRGQLDGFARAQNEVLMYLAHQVHEDKFGRQLQVERIRGTATAADLQVDVESPDFERESNQSMPLLWEFYQSRKKLSDF